MTNFAHMQLGLNGNKFEKEQLMHCMRNEVPQAIDTQDPGQGRVVVRRTAWILLFLIANLLAACGSGGGGDITTGGVPTTGVTCVSTVNATGSSATLTWDPVTAASGYRVYYGTAPGTYEQLPGEGVDAGDCTTYTLNGLGSGTIYYFAVTAYNNVSDESGYSNEVSKQML